MMIQKRISVARWNIATLFLHICSIFLYKCVVHKTFWPNTTSMPYAHKERKSTNILYPFIITFFFIFIASFAFLTFKRNYWWVSCSTLIIHNVANIGPLGKARQQ